MRSLESNPLAKKWSDYLWDLWCIGSVIGIWPRFIEPNLIDTTYLTIQVPNLHPELEKLRILHFTDLHFQKRVSDSFLNRIIHKAQKLKPDIIVFTGDFLCFSILEDQQRLQKFLCSFHARYGCYAVLGNHDYEKCVSINEKGEYDIVNLRKSGIGKGLKRLFKQTKVTGNLTQHVKKLDFHHDLIQMLKRTPFELLENKTRFIRIHDSGINMTGFGEYMLGRMSPNRAFDGYNQHHLGILLLHNPDGIRHLSEFPGDIILSGHTHGGQVNLPMIRKKITLMENPNLIRGLICMQDRYVYINRGIGAVMPFRWFALPEILLITLEKHI